jgi:hypothetical protein
MDYPSGEIMLHSSNTGTKWWWLRIDQISNWSAEEGRGARAIGLTFVGVSILSFFCCFALLLRFDVGATLRVIVSLVIALVLTLAYARQIAGDLFPALVQAGDAAAAHRLGGWELGMSDPLPFLSIWWLDYKFTHGWSTEERWTRNAILAIAAVLFLAPFSFELRFLENLGVSKNTSAVILVLIVLPLTLCLSRLICVLMWPDYVRRADDLARQRQNNRKSPSP